MKNNKNGIKNKIKKKLIFIKTIDNSILTPHPFVKKALSPSCHHLKMAHNTFGEIPNIDARDEGYDDDDAYVAEAYAEYKEASYYERYPLLERYPWSQISYISKAPKLSKRDAKASAKQEQIARKAKKHPSKKSGRRGACDRDIVIC